MFSLPIGLYFSLLIWSLNLPFSLTLRPFYHSYTRSLQGKAFEPDPEALKFMREAGFADDVIIRCLKKAENKLDMAMEYASTGNYLDVPAEPVRNPHMEHL